MSVTDRIARRISTSIRRLHYEVLPRRPDPEDVHGRLRPELRGASADEALRGLSRRWRSDSPAFRVLDDEALLRHGSLADRLLRGEVPFGGSIHTLPERVNWHRDPKFGVEWPRRYVGSISDVLAGSDLVLLWHLNKMQFLLEYSGAYRASGDERLRARVIELMYSWCRDNPYMVGKNWRSAMEAGTRLVAWAIALGETGFPVETAEDSLAAVLGSMAQQAEFVAGHFSEGSLPNNHLIGEAALLYAYSVLCPIWNDAPAWRAAGEAILEREIERQVLSDGVDYENAFNYHAYVLDFYLVFLVARAIEKKEPSRRILDGVGRLARAYLSVLSPSGRIPRFGDDSISEFFVLEDPAALEERGLPSDRVTFAAVVKREVASRLSEEPWGRAPLSVPLVGSVRLAESGFHVFRGRASHVVNSSGPEHAHDFSSGHLHSDAGSFELEVAGSRILIDSGTYLYNFDPAVRSYFRSARAHNTLVLDGIDPMEPRGAFDWRDVPRGRTLLHRGDDRFFAVLTERALPTRLAERYRHRRLIAGFDEALWIVVDAVSAPDGAKGAGTTPKPPTDVAAYFHMAFPPDGVALIDPSRVEIREPELLIAAWGAPACVLRVVGRPEDKLTWYSERYGDLRKGTTIVTKSTISGRGCLVHAVFGKDSVLQPPVIGEDRVEIRFETPGKSPRRLDVSMEAPALTLDGRVIESGT